MPPEGSSRCRRTQDWATPGESKIHQKTVWKIGAQKEVPKTALGGPWGASGNPWEPQRSQNGRQKAPKTEPKTTLFKARLEKWKM